MLISQIPRQKKKLLNEYLRGKKYYELFKLAGELVRNYNDPLARSFFVISSIKISLPWESTKQIKLVENDIKVCFSIYSYIALVEYFLICNLLVKFNKLVINNLANVVSNLKLYIFSVESAIRLNSPQVLLLLLCKSESKNLHQNIILGSLECLSTIRISIEFSKVLYNSAKISSCRTFVLTVADFLDQQGFSNKSKLLYNKFNIDYDTLSIVQIGINNQKKAIPIIALRGRTVYLFLHIPRTGGTSIKKYISSICGDNSILNINGSVSDYKFIISLAESKNDKYSVISGHFSYGVHRLLHNGNVKYVTIIRNPIDSVISTISYSIRPKQNLLLPSSNPSQKFEYLFNKWFRDSQTLLSRTNLLVKALNGIGYGDTLACNLEDYIAAAQNNLMDFDIVSFFPNVDIFSKLLLEALGYSNETSFHLNSSNNMDVDPTVRMELERNNKLDCALYVRLLEHYGVK